MNPLKTMARAFAAAANAGRQRLLAALAVSTAIGCSSAWPESAAKVPRVAFLGIDSQMQAANITAFRERMGALGYIDGRTVVIDYRWAEGRFERLPELARELVAAAPDVIVTAAPQAVRAVQGATSSIPTVATLNDPVGGGFAKSLANPGGNITGLAFQDSGLSVKRMDLLRQLVPGITKVAVIWNRDGGGESSVRALLDVALPMGVQMRVLEVVQPADLAAVVLTAKSWGAQGIVQLASPVITRNRALLIEAAARHGMPMMCELRIYVVDGCLATYSASLPAIFAQMADYVDRLLRGTRVDSLPIEQPREFEFVINQKTSDTLGVVLSPLIRLQATEIIRQPGSKGS